MYTFLVLFVLSAAAALAQAPLIFTQTPRYAAAPEARFPAGASLEIVDGGRVRPLVPGFAASADAAVSYDGLRVLFSAKPKPGDAWQIWEMALAGGAPRKIAAYAEDAIAPFYLPGGHIVYARRARANWQIETIPLEGGEPARLTYTPGSHLPTDVLRDGRILFEAPFPAFPSATREIYTVYSDGSGVEAYRCDHGPSRHAARQVASRDVVFATPKGLARFTSALAAQVNIESARGGEFAGPVAEISPENWLVAFRPNPRAAYALYHLAAAGGAPRAISDQPGVQPALLAAREAPLRFPSGLHDWAGANVLCLNAYTSQARITEGSIASVRLYSQGAGGQPSLLGETAVESDGSFFLHVPSEQPLRIELRDRSGRGIVGERGWFWMRRGEQRVCVGCHAGPERAPENAVPKVLLRRDVPVRMTGGGV